ncbi:MAG TPA: hypothetical protein VIS76_08040 [Pseudomonadales bacterium]
MNWDAIGAAGEILGALSVLITLVYLSSQIRLSNRVSRFDTMTALMEKFESLNRQISNDPELRHSLMKDEQLSADEEEQVYSFVNMFCNTWTMAQTAKDEGLIDEGYFLGLKRDVTYEIERFANFGNFVKRWLDTYPGPARGYEIFSEVDNAVARRGSEDA